MPPEPQASMPCNITFVEYVEVDAEGLFDPITEEDFAAHGSADWRWVRDDANFTHKDACEFIVYIPYDDPIVMAEKLKSMLLYGCSADLITTYFELAVREARVACFFS